MDSPGADLFVVFSNCEEGRDDEFNRWYDEQHLGEVLGVDGFVSAQRFRLHPDQQPGQPAPPWEYLAVYQVEGDVARIHERFREQAARFVTPAGLADFAVWVYSPLGGRVERAG